MYSIKQKALVLLLGLFLLLILDVAILAGMFEFGPTVAASYQQLLDSSTWWSLTVRSESAVSHGHSRHQDRPAAAINCKCRTEKRWTIQRSWNLMKSFLALSCDRGKVFHVKSETKCVFFFSYLHSTCDVLIWNFAASFCTKPPGTATSAQKTSNYT